MVPKAFNSMFRLGMANLGAMRWGEAVIAFELCTQLQPSSGSAWANLALAYLRLGHLDRALSAAEEGVAREPGNGGAWTILSETRRNAGELTAAVDAAKRGVRVQPGESLAYGHLALAYRELGEHEKALAAVRKARKWARSYDPLLCVIAADSLRAIGKLDAALKEYQTVIDNEGNPAPIIIGEQPILSAWRGKGIAHLMKAGREGSLDECQRAVEAFEETIRLNPRDAKTWGGMGFLLRKLGRFESSLDGIERAIDLGGRDDFLGLQRGLTLSELDRNEEALGELEAVVEESVDESLRREALTYRPGVLLRMGRLEECLGACDEALEQHADNAVVRNTKGCALLLLERPDEAAEEFETARRHSPSDPVVLSNLGNLARIEQRYGEADKLLGDALEGEPSNAGIWIARFLSLRDQDRRQDAEELVARASSQLKSMPSVLRAVLSGVREASLEKSLALNASRIAELEEALAARHATETPLEAHRRHLRVFEALLTKDAVREEEIKQFLKSESSRFIFGLDALRMYTEHELGSDFQTDFVLEYPRQRYVMVEIENPRHRLYTTKGKSAALVHACQQVEDWQQWVEENNAYAQKKLPGCASPEGLVIVGRASALTDDDRKRLERSNVNTRGRMTINTYDDLIERARAILGNLLAARVDPVA